LKPRQQLLPYYTRSMSHKQVWVTVTEWARWQIGETYSPTRATQSATFRVRYRVQAHTKVMSERKNSETNRTKVTVSSDIR